MQQVSKINSLLISVYVLSVDGLARNGDKKHAMSRQVVITKEEQFDQKDKNKKTKGLISTHMSLEKEIKIRSVFSRNGASPRFITTSSSCL